MKKFFWGALIFSTVLTGCKQEEKNTIEANTNIIEPEETVKYSELSNDSTYSKYYSTVSTSVELQTKTSTSNEINTSKFTDETSTSIENDTQINENKLEEHYYTLIKNAKQKQTDYINSIEDPNIRQSVQSSHSAAIFESSSLSMEYPENQEIITRALQKVFSEK